MIATREEEVGAAHAIIKGTTGAMIATTTKDIAVVINPDLNTTTTEVGTSRASNAETVGMNHHLIVESTIILDRMPGDLHSTKTA